MTAPRLEIESTYEFSSADAMRIIESLNAVAGSSLAVDERAFKLRELTHTVRVYLYLRSVIDHSSDRLIFSFEDGAVRARRSLKHSELVGDELLKFHDQEIRTRSLADWISILQQRAVVAGLTKFQWRYRFRGPGRERVKVGVAAMVPFHPLTPSRPGEPFFHLEIEGTSRRVVVETEQVLRSSDDAFRRMRPIRGSKQRYASQFERDTFALAISSEAELLHYVRTAQESCVHYLGTMTRIFGA